MVTYAGDTTNEAIEGEYWWMKPAKNVRIRETLLSSQMNNRWPGIKLGSDPD